MKRVIKTRDELLKLGVDDVMLQFAGQELKEKVFDSNKKDKKYVCQFGWIWSDDMWVEEPNSEELKAKSFRMNLTNLNIESLIMGQSVDKLSDFTKNLQSLEEGIQELLLLTKEKESIEKKIRKTESEVRQLEVKVVQFLGDRVNNKTGSG